MRKLDFFGIGEGMWLNTFPGLLLCRLAKEGEVVGLKLRNPWDAHVLETMIQDMCFALGSFHSPIPSGPTKRFILFANGTVIRNPFVLNSVWEWVSSVLSVRNGLPVILRLPSVLRSARVDTKLHSDRELRYGNLVAFLVIDRKKLVYKASFGEKNLNREIEVLLKLHNLDNLGFVVPSVVEYSEQFSWVVMTQIAVKKRLSRIAREKYFLRQILPKWHSVFGLDKSCKSNNALPGFYEHLDQLAKANLRNLPSLEALPEVGIRGTTYGSRISRSHLFKTRGGKLALLDFEDSCEADISADFRELHPSRVTDIRYLLNSLLGHVI